MTLSAADEPVIVGEVHPAMDFGGGDVIADIDIFVALVGPSRPLAP